MKKVFDAALKTESGFREPSAPILAMLARLAALVAPEARAEVLERLLALTAADVEHAEGTGVPLAFARLRHASSLERAGRVEDAAAEAARAAALVAKRGDRTPSRFRIHLLLLERALARKDPDDAERQLTAAREHVPLDDMDEHPMPEHAADLAAACARLGHEDAALAIADSVDEDARDAFFVEGLAASTAFERESAWARPFLARLAALAREGEDPFGSATRLAALARLQTRLEWPEDARRTLEGSAALLGERDEGEDPELDAIRADLADAAAGAGAFEEALALLAPVPDGPNLSMGLLRPLSEAGEPWRARAFELARACDRPPQALLEVAAGAAAKDPAAARAALAEAQEDDGFEDSDLGVVARLQAVLGDAAAASATLAKLRAIKLDVTDPYGALALDLAVHGAEAAGDRDLVDTLLADALARIGSVRDTPSFSRTQSAAGVLGTAIEIAENRVDAKVPVTAGT